MEMTFSQIVELMILLGSIAGLWVKVQTKLKQIEVEVQLKFIMLESRLNSLENFEDKVLKKLDSISDQINDLKIELNNKQDKI